jgi:hypothetical protein
MHFWRVKRGRMLRHPKTGETLGTPGQLVPQEHRDLDPGVCLGPVAECELERDCDAEEEPMRDTVGSSSPAESETQKPKKGKKD